MANETHNILKILVENPEEKYSIRKLSKLRDINYKSAYQAVMKLEKQNIINLERLGNIINCSFSKRFNESVFAVEYERRQEIIKNKNILVMLDHFRRGIKTKFYVMLLFGSYAKKTQTKRSDIDILFIAQNGTEEKLEKEVYSESKMLPLKLHCLVFSEKQFKDMLNSKEPDVGKEAAKNNIILYGIETYYEMIR